MDANTVDTTIVRVVKREHVDGVTTLHFTESPEMGQLIALVPGYGVGEAAYHENDSRKLPPNIILAMDGPKPLRISYPTTKWDGVDDPWAWTDKHFKNRLRALLGEQLFRHASMGTSDDALMECTLNDEAIQRWQAVADIPLGSYNFQTIARALGIEEEWLGHRYR